MLHSGKRVPVSGFLFSIVFFSLHVPQLIIQPLRTIDAKDTHQTLTAIPFQVKVKNFLFFLPLQRYE